VRRAEEQSAHGQARAARLSLRTAFRALRRAERLLRSDDVARALPADVETYLTTVGGRLVTDTAVLRQQL